MFMERRPQKTRFAPEERKILVQLKGSLAPPERSNFYLAKLL